MERRSPQTEQEAGVERDASAGAVEPRPVRRAPFATNPTVGARGLRAQQRILDAALEVFGESGYDRATLDAIARVAGCSRVSVYQYFSGKDDLFRHLASQVARQLRASTEALGPVTPDADGRDALRGWVGRYAGIHARYAPVFRAFAAAAATDAALSGGAADIGSRNVTTFHARVDGTELPSRQLGRTIGLALGCVNRAVDVAAILRGAAPEAYVADRVNAAIADVLHRLLFGLRQGVNDEPVPGPRPPRLDIGPALLGLLDHARQFADQARQPGRRALASLLAVGADVVTRHGYAGTRVDDVVEAAGVSHGAFYRYFDNIEDFVRVVAARALNDVSGALADLPASTDPRSLHRWLRPYSAVHAANGVMIRIWVEAVEEGLRTERAAVLDWGRRRMARLLAGRPFGDPDVDGALLLALVDSFGASPRATVDVHAATRIIERGFLGRDHRVVTSGAPAEH